MDASKQPFCQSLADAVLVAALNALASGRHELYTNRLSILKTVLLLSRSAMLVRSTELKQILRSRYTNITFNVLWNGYAGSLLSAYFHIPKKTVIYLDLNHQISVISTAENTEKISDVLIIMLASLISTSLINNIGKQKKEIAITLLKYLIIFGLMECVLLAMLLSNLPLM